jgi:hypothetical protein
MLLKPSMVLPGLDAIIAENDQEEVRHTHTPTPTSLHPPACTHKPAPTACTSPRPPARAHQPAPTSPHPPARTHKPPARTTSPHQRWMLTSNRRPVYDHAAGRTPDCADHATRRAACRPRHPFPLGRHGCARSSSRRRPYRPYCPYRPYRPHRPRHPRRARRALCLCASARCRRR